MTKLVVAFALMTAACGMAQPTEGELRGSWALESTPSSGARVEFQGGHSCSPNPAFSGFLAGCNSKTARELVVQSCTWGVVSSTTGEEIQVIVDSSSGFLALRMGAQRQLGRGGIRLQGRCVDKAPYALTR